MRKDNFNNLLSWLGGEDNYILIHSKLVCLFERRDCLSAEELADNTLDIVSKKIEENGNIKLKNEEIVQNKMQHILGIAKNKCYEYWRDRKKIKPLSTTCDISNEIEKDFEKELPDEYLKKLQKECLDELRIKSQKKWELIVKYYYDDEISVRKRHEKLAKKLNITMNALAWRIKRIKDNLHKCVEKKQMKTT